MDAQRNENDKMKLDFDANPQFSWLEKLFQDEMDFDSGSLNHIEINDL